MTAISHILLIEEKSRRVEQLLESLDPKRFLLDVVHGLAAAWARLEALPGRYDVVILGCKVRQTTAGKLLQRIRQSAVARGLHVVLQDGAVSRLEMPGGIRAGALFYLPEPFEQRLLTGVLETAAADRVMYRRRGPAHFSPGYSLELLAEAQFRFRTLEDARALASMLAGVCPNPARAVIGLSELLINAVEHGNLGISYEQKSRLLDHEAWEKEIARRLGTPGHAERQVRVRYRRTASVVQVVITDEGEGFDWRSYMEVASERLCDSHGRGIALARALSFDDIEYRGRGNEVAVRIGTGAEPGSDGLCSNP